MLMPSMRSTTTLRSAEQFPSESVTRARYLPPSPYFFFSAKTVDPGYFVSRVVDVRVDPAGTVRNRFSHGRKAFDLNQDHCIVKFVGRAIGEPGGCAAVDFLRRG